MSDAERGSGGGERLGGNGSRLDWGDDPVEATEPPDASDGTRSNGSDDPADETEFDDPVDETGFDDPAEDAEEGSLCVIEDPTCEACQ